MRSQMAAISSSSVRHSRHLQTPPSALPYLGMNLLQNPKLAGALRALAILVGTAILTAILTFFSNQANLTGLFNPYVAGVIAMIASAIESNIANKGGGAMFGAIS